MSQLFASRGQSIGALGSASVLSVNIQGWFSLGSIGLFSSVSWGLPKVFSSATTWKYQFFNTHFYGPTLINKAYILINSVLLYGSLKLTYLIFFWSKANIHSILTNLESWLVIVKKTYLGDNFSQNINLQMRELRPKTVINLPKEQIHVRKIQHINPDFQTLNLPFF